MASCKGCHHEWAHVATASNWQSRIQAKSASRIHAINHYNTVPHEARQDQVLGPWRGPLRTPSTRISFVSPILILPANLRSCLTSSIIPADRATLYRWGTFCVCITNAGFWSTSKSLLTPPGAHDNEYLPQGIRSLSKVKQKDGARKTHHSLKPTVFSALNTQLWKWKVLWKGHPVTFLSLTPSWLQDGESANRVSPHALAHCLAPGPAGPEPSGLPGLVSSQEFSLHPPFDPVAQEVFLNEHREAQFIHPSGPRSKTFSSQKKPLWFLPATPHPLRSGRNYDFRLGGLPWPQSLDVASLSQLLGQHPA